MRVNKYQRIQVLRYFGLNTENSILIACEDDIEKNRAFLDQFDKYSVRTFSEHETTSGRSLHLPTMTREEFFGTYRDLLKEGLNLIVAEQIDPTHAELAGCIMRRGWETTIEIAIGPGTVRRVTHEGRIDERYVCYGFQPHTPNLKVNEALVEIYRFEHLVSDPPDECIYEFSYYRIPVGWRKQRVIFWEITGAHGQELDLVYYYG